MGFDCKRRDRVVMGAGWEEKRWGGELERGMARTVLCIPNAYQPISMHRIHGQLIYNRNKASSFSINRKLFPNPSHHSIHVESVTRVTETFVPLFKPLSSPFFFTSERSLPHNTIPPLLSFHQYWFLFIFFFFFFFCFRYVQVILTFPLIVGFG